MAGGWFPNLQCLNMRGYFAEPLFLSTPLYNEFKKAKTYHIQLTPPALSHANDLMLLQNWEFSHKLNSSPCIQLWAPMNYNKWFIKSILLDSRVTSSYSSQHAAWVRGHTLVLQSAESKGDPNTCGLLLQIQLRKSIIFFPFTFCFTIATFLHMHVPIGYYLETFHH